MIELLMRSNHPLILHSYGKAMFSFSRHLFPQNCLFQVTRGQLYNSGFSFLSFYNINPVNCVSPPHDEMKPDYKFFLLNKKHAFN